MTSEKVGAAARDWVLLMRELVCTGSAAFHGALSLTEEGVLTLHCAAFTGSGATAAITGKAQATAAAINLLFICDISLRCVCCPTAGRPRRSQESCRIRLLD